MGSGLNISGCTNLTSLTLPVLAFARNGIDASNCALDVASVDAIFNRAAIAMVASGVTEGIVTTVGGTNAAPTSASASARAILTARGIEVDFN
jgi:hypothetical protein